MLPTTKVCHGVIVSIVVVARRGDASDVRTWSGLAPRHVCIAQQGAVAPCGGLHACLGVRSLQVRSTLASRRLVHAAVACMLLHHGLAEVHKVKGPLDLRSATEASDVEPRSAAMAVFFVPIVLLWASTRPASRLRHRSGAAASRVYLRARVRMHVCVRAVGLLTARAQYGLGRLCGSTLLALLLAHPTRTVVNP